VRARAARANSKVTHRKGFHHGKRQQRQEQEPNAPCSAARSSAPQPPSEEEAAAAKAEAAAAARASEQAEANRLREAAAAAAESGTSEYKVAPGQSIVCLRGHVDENQPISAADFKDKDVALADLIRRGAIVKS
jgi:hypothetical protein